MSQDYRTRAFAEGERIFSQGDAPDVVYVIRSGGVKIFRTQDGTPTTLGVLRAGDMFGEMAILDRKPRSASAEAVGDTECDVLDAEEFRQLAGGPAVWVLLEKMARRIREVDEHIEKINVENVKRQSALSSISLRRSFFE